MIAFLTLAFIFVSLLCNTLILYNKYKSGRISGASATGTVLIRVQAGTALVNFTYPENNSAVDLGLFNVSVNLSAVQGGGISNCNITLGAGNSLNITSTNPQFVSFVKYTGSILLNWSLNATIAGITYINVTSSCEEGASSFDMVRIIVGNITGISAPVIHAYLADNHQDVVINWSAITNAQYYAIYFDNNLTYLENINAAAVSANVTNITSLNWTDNSSYDKMFYRISAVYGNIKNISIRTAGKYDYSLGLEANLVSSPFELMDENVSNTFKTIPSEILNTLYYYDAGFKKLDYLANYGWYASDNAGIPSYNYNSGYFINALDNATLKWVGLVPVAFNISLSKGANLVSWHYPVTKTLGEAINTSITGCVQTVYKHIERNIFEKSDYLSGYGYWPAIPGNLTTLEPGKGYWFLVMENCTWYVK